jgi:hypothetical protein
MDFSPRRPEFEPRSGFVGFVVDKVALGKVFSNQSTDSSTFFIFYHPKLV